jgi:nicotinate-nucleotide pyrophosphorylase (carboxylating)
VKTTQLRPLEPAVYRDLVRRALEEDLGRGDLTSDALVQPDQRGRGIFMAKSACVLAGVDVAAEVFRQLDDSARVAFSWSDGDECSPGAIIGEVTGRARALLAAERTSLNFLQHLSGIATLTRRFVVAGGGRITILDTRKTLPTFRALEKYAVRAGGGTNHRMALDDGILIKDNHIRILGGVAPAVANMKAAGVGLRIEVETQTLEEVDAALNAGADILLLDNMGIDDIREAVRRARGRAKTEISGGVTLERLPQLAATGADFVSSGALTHSAPAVDISFEIEAA